MKHFIGILLCIIWALFVATLKLPTVPYIVLSILGGFIIGLLVVSHEKDFE